MTDALQEAVYRAATYGTSRTETVIDATAVVLVRGGPLAADMVRPALDLFGPAFLDGAVLR